MAKTSRSGAKAQKKPAKSPQQAPTATKPKQAAAVSEPRPDRDEDWTVERMIELIRSPTVEEHVARLKRVGILTEDGEIAPLYKSWGNKVSRTPIINDAGELEW